MRQGLFILFCFLLTACGSGDNPKVSQHHAREGVTAAALSQDGRYALVASVNHNAGLWDIQDNELLYQWHHGKTPPNIIAVAISADGDYALTAEQKNIVLWNISTGKSEAFWATPAKILSISLGPRGNTALIGMVNNTAEWIDLRDGQTLGTLYHEGNVNSVALSADGKFAVTGSDDKLAKYWDLRAGKVIHRWKHKKQVHSVAISPGNRFVYTGASLANHRIWKTDDGKLHVKLNVYPMTVTSARFSKDERWLALGELQQQMTLWDLENKVLHQQWQLPRGRFWKPTSTFIYALAFSPDLATLYTEDSLGYGNQWSIKH